MQPILDIGITFIIFLQGLGTWLEYPMKFFTFLGNEEFYLIAAPAIYWCINSTWGLRAALYLMLSNPIKNGLKIGLHQPRPYWLTTDVKAYITENTFGIPSGHSMSAVIVWGWLASAIRRRWAWVVAILIILLISFSRMYLGVHFPSDILGGWVVGIVTLWLMAVLDKPVTNIMKQLGRTAQVLIIFAVSVIMLVIGMIATLTQVSWVMPINWTTNALAAMDTTKIIYTGQDPSELAEEAAQDMLKKLEQFNPRSLSELVSSAGAFFGMAMGALWINWRGGFETGGSWKKRIIRYLLGLLILAAIWQGLGMIFPRGHVPLPYVLRYLRYSLVGFWVTGLAPFFFIKLGLTRPVSQ